ncbi:MAG: tRNA guanosine(34) transglycosylase Tgt [Candidatus Hydrogenedentota bacterium]|nr:MAG: tRNA guanosine(34) transglycosylase Tgt [Candidatus Hydrogenedentota bacterium]
MNFSFQVENTNDNARSGILLLPSGVKVLTPVFMPVGTRGSVKTLDSNDLDHLGFSLILGNTYHLYLRPGEQVIKKFGGLKKFISFSKGILTDSGGFQAFSLSQLTKYHKDGVEFRSHLDGSKHFFTPQKTLDIEHALGSDIVMPLDDCAPYPAEKSRLKEALLRTHDWLQQSKTYWLQSGYAQTQALFGIVQGGTDLQLRRESAEFCSSLDLPGYAVGGLSVGEKKTEFRESLQACLEILPKEKPRYLMGVGSIPEILDAVKMGTDMFDCVLPTRNARNGQVFTSAGKLNLRSERLKFSEDPIDTKCHCYVCERYSRGYLRHLHKVKEITALRLSTYHNLFFMKQFMDELRKSIVSQTFPAFYTEWMNKNW